MAESSDDQSAPADGAVEEWSAQLRVMGGRAVEDAPQLGVAESVDRLGRLVRLAILAEPAADGAEPFLGQFVQRIAQLFDPASRSLTGALRFAAKAAHDELRAWNQERLPAERAIYGLTCIIQREDGPALLARAGPSAALLAGPSGMAGLRPMALYAHVPTVAGAGDSPPIGGEEPVVLSFTSASEPFGEAEARIDGGWALLVTSNAAPVLDAERRLDLSRLPAPETLRLLYPALLELRDAAALAVSLGDPAVLTPPPSGGEQEEDSWDEEALEASEAPMTDTERSQFEAAPVGSEQPGTAHRRGELLWQLTSEAELQAVDWPVNPFAAREMGLVETISSPLPPAAGPIAQAAAPIFALASALPSLRERWDTPTIEPPRIPPLGRALAGGLGARPARVATARRAGLLLAAMLAVLAAVAAVLLGPALLRSDADELQTQIERARNSVAAAQLASETESARLALEDALAEVETALALNPLAADALQLRSEIELALSELALVQSPGELSIIADVSAYGPSVALGAVAGGRTDAFVLDDAGGRVFRIGEDNAVSVVFQEGEPLGLADGARAGRPISLAWQAAAGGADSPAGALWILDSVSRLFRWTPAGVLLVPVPELVRLGSVDAVAGTAGSLYLLDGAGGAIWRFTVSSTTGGVELSPPVRAVGRTDLLGAHELRAVVTEAGAVEFVVASVDGRVRRFGAEGERALATGLSQGLVSPASLSLGAHSGLVYVVDRGDGRLVAIGPDGSTAALIQSPALSELRGAWVNEDGGRIVYALADRVLEGRLPTSTEP